IQTSMIIIGGKHFTDFRDFPVVIAVENQEAVRRSNPTRLLLETVVIHIKENAAILLRHQLDPVTAQIKRKNTVLPAPLREKSEDIINRKRHLTCFGKFEAFDPVLLFSPVANGKLACLIVS